MSIRSEIVHRILRSGAIGIVRVRENVDLVAIVEALHAGGVECIEITMTTPGVLEAIRRVAGGAPDLLIGAGTVLTPDDAEDAMDAGARFLVSPTFSPDVVDAGHARDAVVIPGAMTPTEIHTAWMAGADLVKVFPASVGGPAMIRALRGPLPRVPLAPTGGVDGVNAGAYVEAGADVVCVGGWLVPREAVERGEFDELTRRAGQLMDEIQRARGRRNS